MPAARGHHAARNALLCNVGALLLFSLACSRPQEDAAPGAGAHAAGTGGASEPVSATGGSASSPASTPAAASASASTGSSSAAQAEVAAAPLSEASVRSLLDGWLDAQNRGDFAAYEKLYAERFTGIKRSGERTRSFGRSEWMDDRASMFKRPMRVTASAIDSSVSPRLARVTFEQSWSSATYRDTGPKELLIVAGATSPRIAREEMLASSIGNERPVAPQTRLRLIDGGMVILSAAAKPDWSQGPLRSGPRAQNGVAQVLRDADEAHLPPALAQRKNQPVRVFDARGHACESRIAALAVRGVIIPHFGMAQAAEDGTPADRARLDEEVWTLSEQKGRQLVGVLEPACDGVFALDASDVSPEVYPAATVEGELKRAAIASFRERPEYAKIQRRYVEETHATTPWHEDPARHTLEVWSFTPRTGQRLLVLAAEAGEYCGGFGGGANAVFGVDPSGKLSVLGFFEGDPFAPATAFDLDGDGQLEILSGPEGLQRERALLRQRGGKVVRDVLSSVPSLDCPC